MKRCRVSGATVIPVGVSVWMSVRWMEVKGTYGIVIFFNFIATNTNGRCLHDTSGVLGGRGYPSSQM